MSSQFKVHTDTWGTFTIYAIHEQEGGSWEREWEPLRQAEDLKCVVDLISPLSYDAYLELKHQHVKPFLDEIGLGPDACRIKLQDRISFCFYQDTCPSWNPAECGAHLDPPPCYDANYADPVLRRLLTQLFDLWRRDFHVIRVEQPL